MLSSGSSIFLLLLISALVIASLWGKNKKIMTLVGTRAKNPSYTVQK